MLRIKTIHGGDAEAARYYSPDNAQRPDEYYGADAARAVWWSPGETFGVRSGAEVQPAEAKRAFAGQDPAGSGRALTQAQSSKDGSQRRAAFHLNMSLPKSVSVLHAAADRDARREMVAEMQRRGDYTVRTGRGGAEHGGADRGAGRGRRDRRGRRGRMTVRRLR